MTRTQLIEDLKVFTEDALKDFVLPVKPTKADQNPDPRSPVVFKMRVPDTDPNAEKAPCVLLQVTEGSDIQPEGEKLSSTAGVRIVFMVYCKDEQEGGMMLLEVMERFRIELLKKVYLNNQFMLNTKAGMDTSIYSDNTAPYYVGEINTTWIMPAVQREVKHLL